MELAVFFAAGGTVVTFVKMIRPKIRPDLLPVVGVGNTLRARGLWLDVEANRKPIIVPLGV